MSDIVIKAEDVGKLYKLGEIGTGTISHDLNRWLAKMRGKEDPFAKVGEVNDRTAKKGESDWVWALKDINFEVKQGEVLGIIGRNGAGKSTLLKILSKVTTPSTGRIKVKGRIASLLEVGTGFHPELTGRENIFLNGAILGMTKSEIKSKFDEIVDFSGVERYIDTPVKRYSSGMYVRLAFAVAAFLDPEILIVDEVLAVGDAEFQKKCLGRMKDVSVNDGRTVLFVSHNMAAVKNLCNSGVLMSNGTNVFQGNIEETVTRYLSFESISSYFIDDFSSFIVLPSPFFKPLKFGIVKNNQPVIGVLSNKDDIDVFIEFEVFEINDNMTFGVAVHTLAEELIFWTFSKDQNTKYWPKIKEGINKVCIKIPSRLLNEGEYKIYLMSSIHYQFWITNPEKGAPYVNLSISGGLSDSEFWIEKRPGIIAPVIKYINVDI